MLSAALSTSSSVTDILRSKVFGEFSASVTVSVSAVRTDFTLPTALMTSVSMFPVIALKPAHS